MKTVSKLVNGFLFGSLVLAAFVMLRVNSQADQCYDDCYEDPACVGSDRYCRVCDEIGTTYDCSNPVPQQIIYGTSYIESYEVKPYETGNRATAGNMETCYTTAWCGHVTTTLLEICSNGASCVGGTPSYCQRCGTVSTPVKTPLQDYNCGSCS